jgi:phosphatidylserine decarboxylase
VTVARVSIADRLFATLQYALPKRLLARMMHTFMRSEIGWLKRAQIATFRRRYAVDLDEAVEPDATAYPTFNAFFTRALKPGVRPVAAAPDAIASPVDGTVSQAGRLDDDRILQAKGRTYSLLELVGEQGALARSLAAGSFACLYLAPCNYHRIHMPLDGRLASVLYVPGEFFSVNGATARAVPDLFARNERLVCEFATAAGRVVIVMIGALFVGSIETTWCGEVNPPPRRRGAPAQIRAGLGTTFRKGEEIGRFNMGSTVVLLAERGRLEWRDVLQPGAQVRVGQAVGTLRHG